MASVDSPGTLATALARVRRRLIPFLFLLYVVAYLDRINVAFAALQMNEALGFSATTYGLGAGIFFLGYVLFEIPSNVVLARVGARLWIARIMITWGVVASAMMFVHTAPMFYLLRFLLGAAEAGFFPGVIFYMTRWFPARERARAFASFMTAAIGAGVVGAPLSGGLLSLDGFAGLHGWQWLFLLEGVPAVILGFVVLRVLTERPADAGWLTAAERTQLTAAVAADAAHSREQRTTAALRSRRTWLLAVVYFVIPVTLYGIGFWLPQMVKASAGGVGNFTVGVLSALPYACGVAAMVLVGARSDRAGERRRYILATAALSAAGLILAAFATSAVWTIAALSLAMTGVASMLGPFWAFTTASMRGVGAAAAIALVNSLGNTGGFVGPFLLGAISQHTQSFAPGLFAIAAMQVAAGALVLAVRNEEVDSNASG
jgi:ACS family tartrate transporter-like MFS transporter